MMFSGILGEIAAKLDELPSQAVEASKAKSNGAVRAKPGQWCGQGLRPAKSLGQTGASGLTKTQQDVPCRLIGGEEGLDR